MKKGIIFAVIAAFTLCLNVQAQEDKEKKDEEGYKFTVVKEIPVTSVKDQNRAGTCWCYSGLGFIEAELLRMGKGEYDFSEMRLQNYINFRVNLPLDFSIVKFIQ